jgi:hypothetical protein
VWSPERSRSRQVRAEQAAERSLGRQVSAEQTTELGSGRQVISELKRRPLQVSWVVAGSTEHGSSGSATPFTNEGWDEWSDFTGAAPDSLSLNNGDVAPGWSEYQKDTPDSDEEAAPGWSEGQEGVAPDSSSTDAEMSGEEVDIITGQQYSGAQVTLSQPPNQSMYAWASEGAHSRPLISN